MEGQPEVVAVLHGRPGIVGSARGGGWRALTPPALQPTKHGETHGPHLSILNHQSELVMSGLVGETDVKPGDHMPDLDLGRHPTGARASNFRLPSMTDFVRYREDPSLLGEISHLHLVDLCYDLGVSSSSTAAFIKFMQDASEDPSYDMELPIAVKRPVGRPRKTIDHKNLNVKVERDILDEFTRKAQALGMSQADRVRKLIEDDLQTSSG